MTHFFSLPVCVFFFCFFLNSKIIRGAKTIKKTKTFDHSFFKIDQLLPGKPSVEQKKEE